MNLLILGGSGELGREVRFAAMSHRDFEILSAPAHRYTDITRHGDADRAIALNRPEIVINCAGIVRGRELPDSEYVAVNALAPYYIAEACERYGAKLIQISTDCVFSGRRLSRWYMPEDVPDPSDLYGRTKALGEVKAPHVAVVRTSFTGQTSRLWRWLATETADTVLGYRNQLWSGSTSRAVAETLIDLIAKDEVAYGDVIHLATERPISKYEAVQTLVRHLGREIYTEPVEEPHLNMALCPSVVLPSFYDALDAESTRG